MEAAARSTRAHPTRAPVVLVANDQEWTARSLESILTPEGFEVARAYTGGQAMERALALQPDLIILDMTLPDLSGPEVCRQLRADERVGTWTPIVLTTAGSNGRSRQLEALEAGAWDFAVQPFDGELLLHKVRTFLAARSAHRAAEEHALLDPETKLYSRAGVARRLEELDASARRRGEPLSCFVIRADVPDLLEAAGSARTLERRLSIALGAAIRASDTLGRISPLEFALLTPGVAAEEAGEIARRLSSAFQLSTDLPPVRIGGYAAAVVHGLSAPDWIDRAIEALERTTPDQPVILARSTSVV